MIHSSTVPAASPQAILDFWFGDPGSPDYGQPRKFWFMKNPDFDQSIRDRFLAVHHQAMAGQLDFWGDHPEGSLALLIVLDQFSRNLYRGQPQAFTADSKARAIAQQALEQQFDQRLLPVQRWFIYLPFEHSEAWSDQQLSLQLWQGLKNHLPSSDALRYAQKHAEVIRRFGRFPHRNSILGRPNTPAEQDFLQQPGSGF
ncbi:DUF924 family protein [Lyngbya confervoides]|uniref:DUF924 domain-containing protein n=1 Tax=Lyngbya confervoides BDU141951 TaxID=1574623 RepID=A0ABD4T3H9_9CYAN|nr:DUF924 family protein [Lyngbya confervoides]MCM1982870.1 DUF924 domain-containing protein [Lyngbya confervoides BDU141951]